MHTDITTFSPHDTITETLAFAAESALTELYDNRGRDSAAMALYVGLA
jgi:hypothetical protein